MGFVVREERGGHRLCTGLQPQSNRALTMRNVSNVPAPPKKPVPEEVVPVPVPKKAPPRGRIALSLP